MTANNTQYQFFATTPKGLELLLVDELRELGATTAAEKLAGVTFSGDLALAYRACLWSRLANRILLPISKFPAATPEELYAGVRSINWSEHLEEEGTLAVHFVTVNSEITHTLFGAQKVKDAIVDQFRDKTGTRPGVDRVHPDISVYVYLNRDIAEVSLDLSGESLHRRGYRLAGGSAPLKENLAAAILIRAGWPAVAKKGGSLMDPMCGSGTLLTEAALMAGDIAPGLLREYFGFLGWKKHQPKIWHKIVADAEQRRDAGIKHIPEITGYDQDPIAVTNAFKNIECAGLHGRVHVEKRDVAQFAPKAKSVVGLVVTNPPYGERLGDEHTLEPLYSALGERLKKAFEGWQAAVFTGNPALGKLMGIHSRRQYALFNGIIPCKLLLLDVIAENFIDRSPEANNVRRIRAAQRALGDEVSPGMEMFINRMTKNIKQRRKQADAALQTAYRIYDADLPEYAFAIDVSENRVDIKEYQAPREVAADKVQRRLDEALVSLPTLLEITPDRIYYTLVKPIR